VGQEDEVTTARKGKYEIKQPEKETFSGCFSYYNTIKMKFYSTIPNNSQTLQQMPLKACKRVGLIK
jgi:hypothetical protein